MLEDIIVKFFLNIDVVSLFELLSLIFILVGSYMLLIKEEEVVLSNSSIWLYSLSLLSMLAVFGLEKKEELVYLSFSVILSFLFFLARKDNERRVIAEQRILTFVFCAFLTALSFFILIFISANLESNKNGLLGLSAIFVVSLILFTLEKRRRNRSYLYVLIGALH